MTDEVVLHKLLFLVLSRSIAISLSAQDEYEFINPSSAEAVLREGKKNTRHNGMSSAPGVNLDLHQLEALQLKTRI